MRLRNQEHGDAHDALFWLQTLDEDPSLLDQEVATIQHLEPDEVRLLTAARLQVLEKLVQLRSASIMDLRRALHRDYKRVHTDAELLECASAPSAPIGRTADASSNQKPRP